VTLAREAFSFKALGVLALQAALWAIGTVVLNAATDLPAGSLVLVGVAGFLALAGVTLLWLHRHPDVLEVHDPDSLGRQCAAFADELEAFADSRRLGEPATRTTIVFRSFRRAESPWPPDDGGHRALQTYQAATLGQYHADYRVRGQRLFDRVQAPASIHPDERRLLAQPTSPEDMAAIAERFRGYASKLDGQAAGARLAFLLPAVSDGKHFNDLFLGTWAGYVVVFHVVNDGREAARKVWAEMRVLSANGEEVLREPVRARFPNDTPHPEPGVPSVDLDIPANGRPHAIDSITQAVDEFDSCWVVTDDGLRGNLRDAQWAVERSSFLVEMTVQGENAAPVVQRVAVDLGFPRPRIAISDMVPPTS
jgi:hypothetical protein